MRRMSTVHDDRSGTADACPRLGVALLTFSRIQHDVDEHSPLCVNREDFLSDSTVMHPWYLHDIRQVSTVIIQITNLHSTLWTALRRRRSCGSGSKYVACLQPHIQGI